MKCLVNGKQVAYPEEYKVKVDFLRRSQEWIKAKLADGIVECAYSFPSGNGFIIFNVDSHDDLTKQLVDFPLGPLCEFNVHPICEFNKDTEIVIDEFKMLGVYEKS